MGVDLFAQLIIKVGLPLAEDLLAMAHAGTTVTPENWAALRKKNDISGEDLIPKRPPQP